MRQYYPYIYILIISALLISSCSTTKVLSENESRLKSNIIRIENPGEITANDLQPYLKQKPNTYFIFGWNPFLNVYNWSNGEANGWNNFVTNIGQAPVVFQDNLIESSISNINNHLEHKGYYYSQINDSIITKNKKTTVIYNINLGKQYYIDSIKYVIEDNVLRDLFFADTTNSLVKSGIALSEDILNDEVDRVVSNFRNNGYFQFNKNHFFFNADTLMGNNQANLNFEIRDYTRSQTPQEATPHRKFFIKDIYINPITSDNFSSNTPEGRLAAQLDTTYYKGINIITSQNHKLLIRKKVLSKMITIASGDIYDESDIANTYQNLTNMSFFSGVNIQMNEIDTNSVNCNIKLTSDSLQGYKINLETSTNSNGLFGITPSLSYYHKNIFRGGELLSLGFRGDFQFAFNSPTRSNEFGISSGLSIPDFLFLPDKIFNNQNLARTDFSTSYSFQDRPEYERTIISGSFGYSWNSNNRFFYKVYPIQFNVVRLFNLSESFFESLTDPFLKYSYQDHFDLGFGVNLFYTTDPSANPKNSYFYLRWQHDLSGNTLSLFNPIYDTNESGDKVIWGTPYSQYYKTEIAAVQTWKFGKDLNHAFAARVLAGVGVGYGNSSTLPFEKLFWAGGAYSLRAWQARTVGPGYAQRDTTFSIPNQTGDIRLEANIEYRFPLFWNFDGAAFMDAGNIWTLNQDISSGNNDLQEVNPDGVFHLNSFYKNIAFNWGVGLRLDLDFVLIRLDMGMKLYDPPKKSWVDPKNWLRSGNYAFQFGVGYPF